MSAATLLALALAMSPRAVPLVLSLVLLVGSAVWLALREPDYSGSEPDAVPPAGELAAPADPAELSAVVEAIAGSEAEPLRADEGEELRREAVTFPPGGGPLLQVVEAGTRRPVPFAEVFVAAGQPSRFLPEGSGAWRNRDTPHWATVLEDAARPRRADAEGRVTLPRVDGRLLVAARAPGLFGVGQVRQDEQQPVVELAPDRTLRVRVLDHLSQPAANVNVALCADLGQRVQRVARAFTATDGLAELRHVQLCETWVAPSDPAEAAKRNAARAGREQERAFRARLAVLPAEMRTSTNVVVALKGAAARSVEVDLAIVAGEQGQVRLAAHVQGPGGGKPGGAELRAQGWRLADFVVLAEVPQAAPPHARVSPAVLPADPIELRLLPTTSLTVRLIGPDGAALRSPCRVALRPSNDPQAREPVQQSMAQVCGLEADKPLGAETVALAPVGLGLHFDVRVRFPDDDFDFTQNNVPGPMTLTPYEVVLRPPGWFTVIAGRLVDGAGTPVPAREAELYVAGGRGRVEGETVRLESDGHFELPVRLREPAPPYTLEVQARVGERRCGRLLALPALATGQRIELGDVALLDLPALARGVVRDDLGRPLAGADVAVHVLRGPAWTEEAGVRDRTDAQGRFAIHGEQRPLDLRLRASARGHAPVEQTISFGDVVELALPRHATILAEGVLPPFVPRGAVRATLAGGDKPREVEVRLRGDGRFELRIDGLAPGAYDLVLHVRGLPRPLALAEHIDLPPGATLRPAGIDGLDLRGRLFQYRVRAVDANGQPIDDPGSPLLVELHDAAGARQLTPFPWRGNAVEVVTDAPSVSVVGLAPGCKPARALLAPGDSTLTFLRVHPLHLRLPGLRGLLGPDQRARVSLVFLGDTGLPAVDLQGVDQRSGQARGYPRAALGKASGAVLGAGDEVTVTLMLNGPYEIVLRVDGPGGRVSKSIGTLEAVLDGPEPPTVTVQPDLAAVRDALAELRVQPPRR